MLSPVQYKEGFAKLHSVFLPSGEGITLFDDEEERIVWYTKDKLFFVDYPDSHYPCNAQLYRTKKVPVIIVNNIKHFAYSMLPPFRKPIKLTMAILPHPWGLF